MVQFIDDHRDGFGVEPICAVLPIAPIDVSSPSAPADPSDVPVRAGHSVTISSASRFSGSMTRTQQVYGPRKVWKPLRRDGRPRGALHRGAPDARDGPRRGRPGPGLDDHDPRR